MSTFKFKMASKLSAMSLLAAACVLGPSGTVYAQDMSNDTVLFAGVDAREKAHYPYLGVIHHFSGDTLASGFLARIVGYQVQYEYDTTAVPSGSVDGDASLLEIMGGYQKVYESFTLRGYSGLDYEYHDLSPNNRFDANSGSHVGGKIQGEFETDFFAPNYVGVIATYGSAVDRYWARARAGRVFHGIVVGPEVLTKGDREYNEQRIGAFLLFRNLAPALLTVSAGAADAGDSRGGHSPYISVEVSTTF